MLPPSALLGGIDTVIGLGALDPYVKMGSSRLTSVTLIKRKVEMFL